MNVLDIILGVLLGWGLYKGLKNGIFVEIASIVALIAGVFGAIHFSYIAGNYFAEHMNWDEKYMNITAFIVTFIVIVLAVHLAGKFLTKIADFAMLGILNKLAGAIFGTLKVAVILGALLVFIDSVHRSSNMPKASFVQDSVLYEPVKEIGAFVFSKVLKKETVEQSL